jgi:hypothetical protein
MVRRIVHLEELLKKPVMQLSRLPVETLAELNHIPPPISIYQLRRSLDRDVGYPVVRTDPSLFLDNKETELASEYAHAARLIRETLVMYRHRPEWKGKGSKYLSVKAAKFIIEESELMSKEIQTSDSTRNELPYLMGDEYYETLKGDGSKMEHVNRAFNEIKQVKNIHPVMKKEILQHICRIVAQT